MTGIGAAEQVAGLATTASLNDVFKVQPQLGRWYTAQEDQFGGPKVVVLAHKFWQRRFNGDPSIVGRTLIFDGEPYEVIGVMPPTFTHRNGDFYVPLQRKLDPATRGNHFLSTYARLAPGVPLDRAIREMRALGESLAREYNYNHGIDVRSYREVVVGSIRGPLQVLMGAVLCVLLIACANVANLLLASGLSRRREIAVRLALGAGTRQIARQLMSEALVLAIAGGALGLLLAIWIVRVFLVLAREQSAARRDDPGRRARADLHRRDLHRGRRRVRPVSAVPAEDAGIDHDAARGGHAHAPAAGRRSATAWSSPRSPSRSRCSSAPG